MFGKRLPSRFSAASCTRCSRFFAVAALGCALALAAIPARAIELENVLVSYEADGSATYTQLGERTFAAESHLVTSIPTIFTGSSVNTVVGADRFYTNGFTGGNTITSNIEAGHIWNGHSTLGHVTTFVHAAGQGPQSGQIDRHATWVSQAIGGRENLPHPAEPGIAPETTLRSGAIASQWNGAAYATSFSLTNTSFFTPYASGTTGFGAVDVINSSWGFTDPSGANLLTMLTDGLARANPNTTLVVSAGNSGPGANTVGGPGSGANAITVAALANNTSDVYNSVASFSSRGPVSYNDPVNGTIPGVRAAVDIAAPGDTLTLAFYGGLTGGNASGVASGTAFTYSSNLAGTSFASPITAGGVALMKGAAKDLALPSTALDTRVVKAALLNAADKIPGWTNGQAAHANGNGGVQTTQSLDYASGAGALNLDRTYDQYLTGQADIVGLAGGTTTQSIGWDLAQVGIGGFTNTVIDSVLQGGSTFTATLDWFRDRTAINATSASDNGFANLNLQVWDSTFSTLYSESFSTYNEVEHLSFALPVTGKYGLRVAYPTNVFGSLTSETYGLAWNGIAAAAMLNDSTIALDTLTPVDFGRLMLGQEPTANINLAKTGVDATTYTVTTDAGLTDTADGWIAAGPQAESFSVQLQNVAAGSATAGDKTLQVTIDNTAGDSAAAGQGSDDPDDVLNVIATVLDNRRIDAASVDFGDVFVGAAVSAGSNLSTAGADNLRTRVTVEGDAIAANANGIGVNASADHLFNDPSDSTTRTLAGVFATPGNAAGTLELAVTGEGLLGELVDDVTIDYEAHVFVHGAGSFDDTGDPDSPVTELVIDFGAHLQNSSVAPEVFSVFNLGLTPADTGGLRYATPASLGDTLVLSSNLEAVTEQLVAGGALESYLATFYTGSVGSFETIYTLTLDDDPSILGAGSLGLLTLTLRGEVITAQAAPLPEPSSLAMLTLMVTLAAGIRRRRK